MIRVRRAVTARTFGMGTVSADVSRLLRAWSGGDKAAFDRLLPLVYGELRRMARRYMRGQRGHTLETAALIHEAYLRLIGQRDVQWQDRAHFFGVAATAMRHILVDHARARQAAKRGGAAQRISLDEIPAVTPTNPVQLIALDDALRGLAAVDARKSQIVELKYFGGLTVAEIADVLDISPETVARDWRLARTWLFRELSKARSRNDGP
jgi:RNA polymerase sigma factor (TIGR02999 family)